MHQAVQGLKTRCVDRIYSEGDERLSAVVRSYILLRLEPDRLFQIENNRLVCCHLFPFIATSKRRILPSPQELNVFSTEIFFCHSHFEKCLNSHIKSCFFQSGMSTRCLDSSDYLIMWSSCWHLPWRTIGADPVGALRGLQPQGEAREREERRKTIERGGKKTSAPLHLLGRSAKNKQLRYACPIELFQYADSLTFNQNHWPDGIIGPVLHLWFVYLM